MANLLFKPTPPPSLARFHVIKEVNKLILDGVRAIKNGLKRQGNKGRKKRRGGGGRARELSNNVSGGVG